jgi:hypothetical protein
MSDIPQGPAGVGIGLRRPHHKVLFETERQVDWLEFIPENFVGRGGRGPATLRRAAERWPLIGHGVTMSFGGPDPLDQHYIAQLKQLLDEIDAPYYSDHLCYSVVGGTVLHDLLPLPFTEEAVKHVAPRIREVSERLERPVLVENITCYALMPGSQLTEGEFISAVVDEADCGLLLDVSNTYLNAKNQGDDPMKRLFELPVERTGQIHLAGYTDEGDRLVDTHAAPVVDDVWEMYAAVIRKLGRPVSTLVEWDQHIPKLDELLDEADRARAFAASVLGQPTGAASKKESVK